MKKTVLFIVLIVSTCGVFAQTATYKSGSLLWKISGKDLSKPSYLLGTLHLKPGEYLDSIPGANAALKSCEQVVGEIPMSDMMAVQMKMMQAMMMTPDTTYKMLYSDEDFNFVSEQLKSFLGSGLDGQIGAMKPAAIQTMVVVLAYTKHFPDLNMSNTIDLRVQKEATNDQKPVIGLETAEDQIYVLFGIMSLKRQAEALLCNLKNMDKMLPLIPELIDIYNRADLNKMILHQDEHEYCPSSPEETDALNKDRNNKWMTKLPDIMKDKSSFMAVGALHLAGEDGLLNLLEKSGYRVEAVGL